MRIENKETSKNTPVEVIRLANQLNISIPIASILYDKGYKTYEEMFSFLHPSKERFHDPFLLKGMSETLEKIKNTKESGESILVYGDYDADGICSTTILCNVLREYGIEVNAVIPERENGYGLREEVLDEAISTYLPGLLITVDCGISCKDEVEFLKDIGVDVIVTDHHEIPDEIPDCICVDCKFVDQEYPYSTLSGAGVAYKLGRALIGEEADKYLFLVAIATIGDSMPLDGENRDLVYEGIQQISEGKVSLGIRTLIETCCIKDINSKNIAYQLVPRINAAGRMSDAYSALALLMTKDIEEAKDLSALLVKYNVDRQVLCDNLYNEAKKQILEMDIDRSIVLLGENWNVGLVGIVCARICEEFNVPVVLFAEQDGSIHGSARSIEGVNIYDAIYSCKEYLTGFGGHSQAAGLSIEKENIEVFAKKFNEYIRNNYSDKDFERVITVEDKVNSPLDVNYIKELDLLEPFGTGNKRPIYVTTGGSFDARVLKNGSTNIIFSKNNMDFFYFNGLSYIDLIRNKSTKNVVFEPTISYSNGREYVNYYVKNVEPIDVDEQDTYFYALFRQLNSLKFSPYNGGIERGLDEINMEMENTNEPHFGTIYILNNPNNILKYPYARHLDKNVLNLTQRGGKNCILIGGIPEDEDFHMYKRMVYLDEPLVVEKYPTIKEVVINREIKGFDLHGLTTERESLGEIYKGVYAKLTANKFSDPISLMKVLPFSNKEQCIFAISVFLELGFISQEDYLVLGNQGRRSLTESKIYNKVDSILKGYEGRN